MTPDRASAIFRQLLQTPASELDHFGRRNGLQGHPDRGSLEQAQELLRALTLALESGPGPNWQRINDAWGAMVARHGKVDMSAAGPARPQWIRDIPAKPTLGDPAPGTSGQRQQAHDRDRFVPTAQPHFVRTPPPVAPIPSVAPVGAAAPSWPQQAPAAYPATPQPQAYGQPQPAPQARQPPPPPRRSAAPAANPQLQALQDHVTNYAAFCAACAAFPERAADTMRDYGIPDEATRRRIDDTWADRFDDDGDLHLQWESLFRQFRQRISGG